MEKESELQVITKAKELCEYIMTITQKSPKETLIKCFATANTADLPHNFGKNAQNTTSIPALFACTMH